MTHMLNPVIDSEIYYTNLTGYVKSALMPLDKPIFQSDLSKQHSRLPR